MDGSGALYGTAFGDASSDQGKVFKLIPAAVNPARSEVRHPDHHQRNGAARVLL